MKRNSILLTSKGLGIVIETRFRLLVIQVSFLLLYDHDAVVHMYDARATAAHVALRTEANKMRCKNRGAHNVNECSKYHCHFLVGGHLSMFTYLNCQISYENLIDIVSDRSYSHPAGL